MVFHVQCEVFKFLNSSTEQEKDMKQSSLSETIVKTLLFVVGAPLVVVFIAGGINVISHGLETGRIVYTGIGALLTLLLIRWLYISAVHITMCWKYNLATAKDS